MKIISYLGMLAALLSSQSVNGSSITEDSWANVTMCSDRGDLVTAASTEERITRLEFIVGGTRHRVDTAFARQAEGVVVNQIKVLVDTPDQTGFPTRYVLVPFREWDGVERDGLNLMLTFNRERMTRAAIIENEDMDQPVHVFPDRQRERNMALMASRVGKKCSWD